MSLRYPLRIRHPITVSVGASHPVAAERQAPTETLTHKTFSDLFASWSGRRPAIEPRRTHHDAKSVSLPTSVCKEHTCLFIVGMLVSSPRVS